MYGNGNTNTTVESAAVWASMSVGKGVPGYYDMRMGDDGETTTTAYCHRMLTVPHRSLDGVIVMLVDKVVSSAGGLRELIDMHDIYCCREPRHL